MFCATAGQRGARPHCGCPFPAPLPPRLLGRSGSHSASRRAQVVPVGSSPVAYEASAAHQAAERRSEDSGVDPSQWEVKQDGVDAAAGRLVGHGRCAVGRACAGMLEHARDRTRGAASATWLADRLGAQACVHGPTPPFPCSYCLDCSGQRRRRGRRAARHCCRGDCQLKRSRPLSCVLVTDDFGGRGD